MDSPSTCSSLSSCDSIRQQFLSDKSTSPIIADAALPPLMMLTTTVLNLQLKISSMMPSFRAWSPQQMNRLVSSLLLTEPNTEIGRWGFCCPAVDSNICLTTALDAVMPGLA